MKRFLSLIPVILIAVCLTISGCGDKKAPSSQDAIDTTKTMDTVKAKTDYMVAQAKAFYDSKDFQGAVDIAQYVLRYLDKDNPQAKALLQEAQAAITTQLKTQAEEVKKGFSGFGK